MRTIRSAEVNGHTGGIKGRAVNLTLRKFEKENKPTKTYVRKKGKFGEMDKQTA